jgi:hypothetical protein
MNADEIAKLIPDEVVEAAAKAVVVAWFSKGDWDRLEDKEKAPYRTFARAALAAALAAWPGATSIKWDGQLIVHLKMPLAKETPDGN